MIIKAKGTVTIPKPPRGLGSVLFWCKATNRTLQQLRDRAWEVAPGRAGSSGGGSTEYIPWKPSFFTTGTAPALVYKCRFNLGTVNNVPAGNWNDEFTLPSSDAIKFVILTIATGSGQVTTVTISVDTNAPTTDTIAKDTPPVSHKIVLGAIGKNTAKMIVARNLTLYAGEIFRESRIAPTTGAEPFHRWWRWNVQTY